MQITHLKNQDIKKGLWNDCIDSASNPQIYGLSWYLDVVSPGWEAIVAIDDGKYLVGLPIPIKQRLLFKFISKSYFCQQLGIYFHPSVNKDVIQKVFNYIFTLYNYIPSLSFNINNNFLTFEQKNLRRETLYTHILSLDKPYDKIYKNYKRDKKYRIKKVRKRNIEVVISQDIEPHIQIHKDDTEHRVPGFNADSYYPTLRELFKAIHSNASYELYYAKEKNGTYSASCWFVFYKNQIIYLGNASTQESRNLDGRTFMIDLLIQKYQGSDKVLDFESPSKESIYSYYASFGSTATPFYNIYYNNLPVIIRLIHTAKIKAQRGIILLLSPKVTLPDIHYPIDVQR